MPQLAGRRVPNTDLSSTHAGGDPLASAEPRPPLRYACHSARWTVGIKVAKIESRLRGLHGKAPAIRTDGQSSDTMPHIHLMCERAAPRIPDAYYCPIVHTAEQAGAVMADRQHLDRRAMRGDACHDLFGWHAAGIVQQNKDSIGDGMVVARERTAENFRFSVVQKTDGEQEAALRQR